MTGNFITSRLGDVMNTNQFSEKQRKILDEIRFEAHIGQSPSADSDERKKILRYIEKLAKSGLS
jgi:hypothetical protein